MATFTLIWTLPLLNDTYPYLTRVTLLWKYCPLWPHFNFSLNFIYITITPLVTHACHYVIQPFFLIFTIVILFGLTYTFIESYLSLLSLPSFWQIEMHIFILTLFVMLDLLSDPVGTIQLQNLWHTSGGSENTTILVQKVFVLLFEVEHLSTCSCTWTKQEHIKSMEVKTK